MIDERDAHSSANDTTLAPADHADWKRALRATRAPLWTGLALAVGTGVAVSGASKVAPWAMEVVGLLGCFVIWVVARIEERALGIRVASLSDGAARPELVGRIESCVRVRFGASVAATTFAIGAIAVFATAGLGGVPLEWLLWSMVTGFLGAATVRTPGVASHASWDAIEQDRHSIGPERTPEEQLRRDRRIARRDTRRARVDRALEQRGGIYEYGLHESEVP